MSIVMEEQHQSDDQKDKKTTVQSSINKLKEKFVPGVKYTLLISAAINFSMLVVGCLNVHRCTVNKNIPLFLIATGAIGLMSKFVSYIRDRISKHVQVLYIESALYSVETIFFLLGTYWVYKEYPPSYDPNDKQYCNKTAYIIAFVYVTLFYAFIIVVLAGFCCFICCAICLAKAAADAISKDVESQPDEGATIESSVPLSVSTRVEDEPKR